MVPCYAIGSSVAPWSELDWQLQYWPIMVLWRPLVVDNKQIVIFFVKISQGWSILRVFTIEKEKLITLCIFQLQKLILLAQVTGLEPIKRSAKT